MSLNLTQAEEAINLLLNPTEATSGKEEPTADSSFDIATHLDAAASSRIVENADNRILIQSLDEALLLLRRENESTLTRVKEVELHSQYSIISIEIERFFQTFLEKKLLSS